MRRSLPALLTLLFAFIIAGIHPLTACAEPVTQVNVMIELPFTAGKPHNDPFNDITLDVIFKNPAGQELRVPAFWAGKNVWKVRYASPAVGTHSFRTECNDASDAGLHGIAGQVEIKPYEGNNPLYVHGPVRVAANKRYLEHADGTPFFWLGDTWWMGLCYRLHWPEEVKTLAADRKAKGFTVIQIVAGLYPDMHPFDPRGANEGGFPWEPNYARIRPEYFDAADNRLLYLVDQGFTPCIVGAWGYFLPWMGVDKAKQHWRYLIARYGALPVVWCAAGEANLPWYLAKGFPYDDREQVKGWTEVMRSIRATDPFHRPLTIHPTGIGRLSARHATDDVNLLDIDMLQTPHGQRDAVTPTVNTMRESYNDKPVMPVIDGEAAYEMLGDSLPTKWTRQMFWLCMMNGAAGHTYGANGIWQCNRKGQPHGPSPTAGSPPTGYGVISWDDAMNLPGSRQEGLGKKLLEQYPWQKFQPHPEWAAFAGPSTLSFDGCQWIWFAEGDPAKNAPVGKRFFRRSFELADGKVVKSAQLRVSADDRFTARFNGKAVGSSPKNQNESWKTGKQFDDVAAALKPGANVLAIEAENLPTTAGVANPAGLIAHLEVQFADGSSFTLATDAKWHSATKDVPNWDATAFDDAGWAPAMVVAKHGDSPWGAISAPGNGDAFGPQSAGVTDEVRIIYVPESRSIFVRKLTHGASYSAEHFDPVSGSKSGPIPFLADAAGAWTCPPPAGVDHDWVLIIKPAHGGEFNR